MVQENLCLWWSEIPQIIGSDLLFSQCHPPSLEKILDFNDLKCPWIKDLNSFWPCQLFLRGTRPQEEKWPHNIIFSLTSHTHLYQNVAYTYEQYILLKLRGACSHTEKIWPRNGDFASPFPEPPWCIAMGFTVRWKFSFSNTFKWHYL